METKKLYKLINQIGTYWVIANHPTEAENKLMAILNEADYGLTTQRKITDIKLIAEHLDNTTFLTGKFLIL